MDGRTASIGHPIRIGAGSPSATHACSNGFQLVELGSLVIRRSAKEITSSRTVANSAGGLPLPRGSLKPFREPLARFPEEGKKFALGDPHYVDILMRRLASHFACDILAGDEQRAR